MRWKPGVCVVAVCVLAGCASPGHRAPVEDRGVSARRTPGSIARSSLFERSSPLPGAENAGKPGYYTVKPGDTLRRIGLDTGQNWRDLMRWNQLDNPDLIEVGQVLRVVAPDADPSVASVRPVTVAQVETRPLDSRAPVPPLAGTSVPEATAPVPTSVSRPESEIVWSWPASGAVIAGFDEVRNKGIGIAGKAGDAVLAAADGRVVYAGSGLRGYGNLVIVKHNNTFLTAYAHNQALLVKEDQSVRRGQKIAEMGSTDTDRVKLHFEIRRLGKPVDPAKFLPSR